MPVRESVGERNGKAMSEGAMNSTQFRGLRKIVTFSSHLFSSWLSFLANGFAELQLFL